MIKQALTIFALGVIFTGCSSPKTIEIGKMTDGSNQPITIEAPLPLDLTQ